MKNEAKIFTLDELCTLVDANKRTIRFYIQKGLVDRPEGTGKGAYYTHRHLEQLLGIRKWKDAGLSLERIQELLGHSTDADLSGKPVPPPRPRRSGAVEVWSRVYLQDGLELHIEPQRSGLAPEQVRACCREIIRVYLAIKQGEREDV